MLWKIQRRVGQWTLGRSPSSPPSMLFPANGGTSCDLQFTSIIFWCTWFSLWNLRVIKGNVHMVRDIYCGIMILKKWKQNIRLNLSAWQLNWVLINSLLLIASRSQKESTLTAKGYLMKKELSPKQLLNNLCCFQIYFRQIFHILLS